MEDLPEVPLFAFLGFGSDGQASDYLGFNTIGLTAKDSPFTHEQHLEMLQDRGLIEE